MGQETLCPKQIFEAKKFATGKNLWSEKNFALKNVSGFKQIFEIKNWDQKKIFLSLKQDNFSRYPLLGVVKTYQFLAKNFRTED